MNDAGPGPDLDYVSTPQLIAELLRRETFRGLMIYQQEEFRGPLSTNWRWEARHCDPRKVIEEVLDQLPREEQTE